MAKFEVKLPKMGESVAEATVTNWLKNEGDSINLDEPLAEVATDKVDTEITSEVSGKISKLLVQKNAVVQVGQTMAIIETKGNTDTIHEFNIQQPEEKAEPDTFETTSEIENNTNETIASTSLIHKKITTEGFLSPLVKSIVVSENISDSELTNIQGSGVNGRITKNDILSYLSKRNEAKTAAATTSKHTTFFPKTGTSSPIVNTTENTEIIELTRMQKLTASHMLHSKKTSAHVQSFIEVDVTNVVHWRNKIKDTFFKREKEKITYTPIFMQVVAKTLKDFPMLNLSLEGDQITKKEHIHLGMATALADGNLIVPVIKHADRLNLVGMTKLVNQYAYKARTNQLKPDDVLGGTYTVTNVGAFGTLFGTPIINQPQVGILALGAIRKMPAVIETAEGDAIGIRHKMFISHSYDHRIVNGAMGGLFIKQMKDYLEQWDVNANF